MSHDDEPSTQELKLRQLAEERAEREQLAEAGTGAEAAQHRRRAEKAEYLRQKLEARERSEHAPPRGPDARPPE